MHPLRPLLIAIMVMALYSCSNTQIYQTKPLSEDIQLKDQHYVFENDTVKITYSFWAEKGVLGYQIENKLSQPLYIDWKRSSFIRNGEKIDYYVDQSVTTGTTHSRYYYYWGVNKTVTNLTTTHAEPVLFIAPHSTTDVGKFMLNPTADDLSKDAIQDRMKQENSGRYVTVKYKQFTSSDSPLTFRNFLTFSTSNTFDHVSYIDNGFYVTRISEMKSKDAYQDKRDDRHPNREYYYFTNSTFFYANL